MSQDDPSWMDDGAVEISLLGLGLASMLILVQGAVSVRLGLGLHSQLLVAAIRCVAQLSLLGHILVPIFNYGQLWLVLVYAGFMVWVSAVEAIGRPTKYYKGMFSNTLLIITVVGSSTMVYALLFIIGVDPWWAPQYLIPISGMVLGNIINGISIGLSTVVEELSAGRDQIERLLALGASRSEATADLVGRSVKLAMTPSLNTMSVVGLVSIPGMMTGQILGGSDPAQAARYQMVIMFLLGAASSAASVTSVYAAVFHVVDSHHRLRPERLIHRHGKGGVNGFINNTAWKLYQGVVWLFKALTSCCRSRSNEQSATAALDSNPRSKHTDDLNQPLLAAAAAGREPCGDDTAAAPAATSKSSSQQQQQLLGPAVSGGSADLVVQVALAGSDAGSDDTDSSSSSTTAGPVVDVVQRGGSAQ